VAAGEDVGGRVLGEVARELRDVGEGLALAEEAEGVGRLKRLLAGDPLLRPARAEHAHVGVEGGLDVVDALEAGLAELDGGAEGGEAALVGLDAAVELRGPPLGLEEGEEAARALVAHEVRQVPRALAAPVPALRRKRPHDVDGADVLDGHDVLDDAGEGGGRGGSRPLLRFPPLLGGGEVGVAGEDGRRAAVVLDGREVGRRPPGEDVDGLGAEDGECHAARAVVVGVELEELLADVDAELGGGVAERRGVPGAELAVGVGRARRRLVELVGPPHVALQVLLVLAVDRLELALGRGLGEERAGEEGGEALQGLAEGRRRDG
jgi:hypothetical protein